MLISTTTSTLTKRLFESEIRKTSGFSLFQSRCFHENHEDEINNMTLEDR